MYHWNMSPILNSTIVDWSKTVKIMISTVLDQIPIIIFFGPDLNDEQFLLINILNLELYSLQIILKCQTVLPKSLEIFSMSSASWGSRVASSWSVSANFRFPSHKTADKTDRIPSIIWGGIWTTSKASLKNKDFFELIVFYRFHFLPLWGFFWHFSTLFRLLLPQGIKFVSIVHSIKFDATRLVEVVVELWGLEQKSIRQLLVSLKNRNIEKTFSLTFTIPSIINWLVKKKGQYCDAVSR